MTADALRARAARFLALHRGSRTLVLPNAWDGGSARLFEQAGFAALGTTSAGIAISLGYPDGERISRDEMIAAVARITRVVDLPVSADLEMGYGVTAAEVADTARAAMAAGAVGLNVEDGRAEGGRVVEIEEHTERVRAIRAAADGAGVPFVINARVDLYLLGIGDATWRFEETVRRAHAYREAGADCIFVPLVNDAQTIGRLVRSIDAPLNVLAVAGTPPVAELQALGVARVSVGSGPMRATFALTQRIARRMKDEGTFTAFTDDTIPLRDVNRLFTR
jgi:2-methylisocitrate lyase-like PEP mutase family enzyme